MIKVLTWTLSILLGLVVVAVGLIYVLPGWDLYIVRSDSMKPAFSARDLIITHPVSGQVQPGEIITFRQGGELITHRVVSVGDNSIITKGDANEDPDLQPISPSQITGVYLFNIPNIGYLTSFISTKMGWFLVVILPAMILVGLLIREIIREAFKDDKSTQTAMREKRDCIKREVKTQ